MHEHQIRAVVVGAHGGHDVLRTEIRALAPPSAGQLLVDVDASGVNFVDVYQREGIFPTALPFILGSEGAGTVIAVGDGAEDFAVGDRVAWAFQLGSHATTARVVAAGAVRVPGDVSSEQAAAVILQGMTAHYLVRSTYPVAPGDTVLVHAAAGGVGQLLIQLAVARGARVIATVGSDAKAARARERGATEVINYDKVGAEALAEAIRAANGGAGVQAVYDGVGKTTFDASLASLAPRGTLALFGASSGQVPPLELQRLNAGGSLFVTRPTLANYVATREELLWRSGEVLRAIGDGSLTVETGGRYPLDKAARAYEELESRRTSGKLLLIP